MICWLRGIEEGHGRSLASDALLVLLALLACGPVLGAVVDPIGGTSRRR